jgi:hypothetical protein
MSRPVPHPLVAEALEDRCLPSANPWPVVVADVTLVVKHDLRSVPADTRAVQAILEHLTDAKTAHDTHTKAADPGTTGDQGPDAKLTDRGQPADSVSDSSGGALSVQGLGAAATKLEGVDRHAVGVITAGDSGGTSGGDGGTAGGGGQTGNSPTDQPAPPATSPRKDLEGLFLSDPSSHNALQGGTPVSDNRLPEAPRPDGAAAADGARAVAMSGAALAHSDQVGATDEAGAAGPVMPAASDGSTGSGVVGAVVTAVVQSAAVRAADELLDLLPGPAAVASGVQDLLGRLDGLGEQLAADGGGAVYAWLAAGTAVAALAEVGRRYYVRPARALGVGRDGALAYFPELQ